MQQVINNLVKLVTEKNKCGLYAGSYHALTGIFAGIALNDLWRVFDWPGNNEPILIKGEPSGFDMDFMYQTFIGAAIMFLEAAGWKNATTYGASIIAGAAFANASEKGRTISVVPFS